MAVSGPALPANSAGHRVWATGLPLSAAAGIALRDGSAGLEATLEAGGVPVATATLPPAAVRVDAGEPHCLLLRPTSAAGLEFAAAVLRVSVCSQPVAAAVDAIERARFAQVAFCGDFDALVDVRRIWSAFLPVAVHGSVLWVARLDGTEDHRFAALTTSGDPLFPEALYPATARPNTDGGPTVTAMRQWCAGVVAAHGGGEMCCYDGRAGVRRSARELWDLCCAAERRRVSSAQLLQLWGGSAAVAYARGIADLCDLQPAYRPSEEFAALLPMPMPGTVPPETPADASQPAVAVGTLPHPEPSPAPAPHQPAGQPAGPAEQPAEPAEQEAGVSDEPPVVPPPSQPAPVHPPHTPPRPPAATSTASLPSLPHEEPSTARTRSLPPPTAPQQPLQPPSTAAGLPASSAALAAAVCVAAAAGAGVPGAEVACAAALAVVAFAVPPPPPLLDLGISFPAASVVAAVPAADVPVPDAGAPTAAPSAAAPTAADAPTAAEAAASAEVSMPAPSAGSEPPEVPVAVQPGSDDGGPAALLPPVTSDSEQSHDGGGVAADVGTPRRAVRLDKVRVVICSWNVDQCPPPPLPQLQSLMKLSDSPDLIAVGLQELDMTAGALIRERTDKSTPWVAALGKAAGADYRMLGSRQLVGLFLAVFAARPLPVREVSMQVVKCGAGAGMGGNKGGIGLRLRLQHTTFAFINAHLAAHMGEVQKRNDDFVKIRDTMQWEPQAADRLAKSYSVGTAEHDVTFFFGDLNYRIEMGQDDAVRLIAQRDYCRLLAADQLRRVYGGRTNPYSGFRDALVELPQFDPTYKYTPGSVHYDVKEGGKKRTPAWCDRVLWRAPPAEGPARAGRTRLVAHERCDDLLQSDHRPVRAVFSTEVHPAAPQRLPGSPLGGSARYLVDRISGAFGAADDVLGADDAITQPLAVTVP
eukprot:TRINITY_DN11309_c0_g1_i1.p1 TRINITY_DN11309_c0_g1~~TRINITY_DN11309_c0_g1_i1.p1  ORF type:complete len:979 (+),score=306.84 TRINITY_DN11309_c0_g1_i1:160-2937(+)